MFALSPPHFPPPILSLPYPTLPYLTLPYPTLPYPTLQNKIPDVFKTKIQNIRTKLPGKFER